MSPAALWDKWRHRLWVLSTHLMAFLAGATLTYEALRVVVGFHL